MKRKLVIKLPVQESGSQVFGLGERGIGGRVKRSLEVRDGGTRQWRGGCCLQSHSNCYQCYQFFRCCIPLALCTPAITPIHRSVAVVISLCTRITKAKAEAKDTFTHSKYCHVSATCFAQTSSLFSFILGVFLSVNPALEFGLCYIHYSGQQTSGQEHPVCCIATGSISCKERDKQNLIFGIGWLDYTCIKDWLFYLFIFNFGHLLTLSN